MSTSYYDVVLLGLKTEALICGALLAKRGFRVLLLRQDDLPPHYEVAGFDLARSTSSFLAAQSPIARRIFAELALHQRFRRRARSLNPAIQLAVPRHRFDLWRDSESLSAEILREFPEVQRPIEDFHRNVVRHSAEIDRVLDMRFVWPPEGFFERRELHRALDTLPFDRDGEGADPLAEIADDHPFRTGVEAALRFASDLDAGQLSPAARIRLYDNQFRGSVVFEGGFDWLREALLEKIQTYSGDVRPKQRAKAIVIKRGRATSVRIHGSDEEIGCGFVVASCELSRLYPLLDHRQLFEELFERIGEPRARWHRYVLNLVVREQALPAGMGRDVAYVHDAKRPLEGVNLLHVQIQDAHGGEAHPDRPRVLTVEALLARRAMEERSDYFATLRERILNTLEHLIPFLSKHLLLVDSPYDGRPPRDWVAGRDLSVDDDWARAPGMMESIFSYPTRSALGFCALPTRLPVRNLLLCNGQVAPALGMEGRLLAAASATRIISRADRKKLWMRRSLWTKIEV